MSAPAAFTEDAQSGTLRFTGSLSLATLGDLPERLAALDGTITKLDLSGVERLDTIGAWTIHRFAQRTGASVDGLDKNGQHLFDQVSAADQPVVIRGQHVPPFTRVLGEIGAATIQTYNTMVGLLGFLGATTLAFGSIVKNGRFRFNATVQRFEVVGVSALGIIGLMSFLIGIVIAQQGAVQLRQFGAEVYTINLVGRLTFRELGVLMTAIMVAGRSGSAFAAQIGSMKLAEEVDAMRTIGLAPMEALVLPRVIAAVLMMPCLAFYAAMMALIGGGLFSWLSLNLPPVTFVARIREVVPMTDVYQGLIKAPVFGLIIAMAGCFQGMQVEGNAEAVGLRTTSAVVQSIFLVIVLDAFFAVFFASIGWI